MFGTQLDLFNFSGRATRTRLMVQYGLTILGMVFSSWAVMGIAFMTHIPMISLAIFVIFVAGFLSMFALGVRRLHDIEKSGWWVLVPIIYNIIIIFFLMGNALTKLGMGSVDPLMMVVSIAPFMLAMIPMQIFLGWVLLWPGTKGTNQYGEDPRNRPNQEEDLGSVFASEFFSFQGRISRAFFLRGIIGLIIVIGLWQNNIPFLSGNTQMMNSQMGIVYSLVFASSPIITTVIAICTALMMLLIFISMLSLVARRLHDLDFSGWGAFTLALVIGSAFAPPMSNYFFYIWWIYIFLLAWRPGSPEENQYGEAPSALRFKVWEPEVIAENKVSNDEDEKTPPGSFL